MHVRAVAVVVFSWVLLAGCKDNTTFRAPVDAGLLCRDNEKLIDGECKFICDRDSDCAVGQRCNLLSGKCEARVSSAPPPPAFPCTHGAHPCSEDGKGLEQCGTEGEWQTELHCPEGGFCLNEKCLACQPSSTVCHPGSTAQLDVCAADGSALNVIPCAGASTCVDSECRECSPHATRCSPDGTSLQACEHGADPAQSWKWVGSGDALDGRCITEMCEQPSGAGARCKPPSCFPGTTQCKSDQVQQVCDEHGGFTDVTCSTLPGYSADAVCQNGACIDECAEAAKAQSYFGCEYWSAVQDNGIDKFFKSLGSSTTPQQGTVDSDFAFVVTNRSVNAATIDVYRWFNGAEQKVKSVAVPGRNDPSSHGLAVIKVPWQSIAATSLSPITNPNRSITGQLRYGYRLLSTRPISAYQFNPLDAARVTSQGCTGTAGTVDLSCGEKGGNCNFFDQTDCGTCQAIASGQKFCHYFTYSNDASLLLPTHILGTSYVAVTQEHSNTFDFLGSPADQMSGHLTIVAPSDSTTVTIKSSAITNPSPAGYSPVVPAMNKGEVRTFLLNRYDVLQLASGYGGAQLECSANGLGQVCRMDNDLTGTVVSADHPIAVFGGAACGLKPYNKGYCDHLEEQVFPFATWGKQFVAQQSHAVRVTSGGFATAANAAPDYWKVVAGCPPSQCPNGTLVTLSTPPGAGDVLPPNRCLNGTSLAANTCRLAGGTAMEFHSKSNFTLTGDQPIAVAQFFAGQSATTGFDLATTGDPSFVLLPPVEQWRSTYTVLAAPGIKDNYLGLVIDDSKVASVEVDGAAISGFSAIAGTSFGVKNHPVSVGTHTVNVVPKPGQSPLPGAGIIIYGFDSYVSYGYTGGLDLGTLVTGINPGG